MSDLLFIYGTLHPDRAPAEIAPTARLLTAFARATIQGRLYDLGAYPAVHLSGDQSDTVPGELFHLPDDPSVLARLDDYEDFRCGDVAGSLFLRERTVATLEDGAQHTCWAYIYNRPVT
jgi:gamma-glutamylcyclotransferase (GGCT)/AIG2-like uncharacterized protein YtfP